MALDLTLLGATGLQAVVKLVNYTLSTNLDPKYLSLVGHGSPYSPLMNATLSALTVPDVDGNAPIYVNSQAITYARQGYQKAFQGLNLTYIGPGPYTVGQIVQGIWNTYGILIEQVDIQEAFANAISPNQQGFIELHPAGSYRFYIDFSVFTIKVTINVVDLTDLQKLISMTSLADISALNAANTPAGPGSALVSPPLD
jgi:hypothetical protein